MKKTIAKIASSLIVISLMFSLGSLLIATPASADTAAGQLQKGANAASGAAGTSDTTDTINKTITTVINILSALVGVIAVIMIIVGGYRYITSGGDSAKVTSAKNTLLYAVIGLVIVAMAQVIAQFVLNKATSSTSGTTPSSNIGSAGSSSSSSPNSCPSGVEDCSP